MKFRVTLEMVDLFAGLTGDHSSLHVDEEFARRSPYRRRVVHGMLPVAFLGAALKEAGLSDHHISSVSARFLKPVFPGAELTLTLTTVATEDRSKSFEYSIVKVPSGEQVTAGNITLLPLEKGESVDAYVAPANDATILQNILEENVVLFEGIEKGEAHSFQLKVDNKNINQLEVIYALGMEDHASPASTNEFSTALLFASALSTYVGMCMPGRYATFTEFSVAWPTALNTRNVALHAAVKFLSASTHMLVSTITWNDVETGALVGEGKVKVRVSEPPVTMPTMNQMKQHSSNLGIEDKVVLVTGASRGIGETIAKLFALHGAKVAINYYSGASDAHRIAEEIEAAGGTAFPVQGDVTSYPSVQNMVKEVEKNLGPIEILVNNAAGDYVATDFEHLEWSDVEKDLNIIAKGGFHCCKAVLPGMKTLGKGRIVNLSTIAVESPPVGHAAYVMAKSALLGLTRSLAVEYASAGVTVNAVMPGLVETDLTSNMSGIVRESVRQGTPMKRLTTPVDVARTVVYLASEWAGYTTGQQIAVTGGLPPFS